MNNLIKKIPILLLFAFAFFGCDFGSSEDEQYRKASIIAQDFVEEKMGSCNFESLNYVGEKTLVENRYKILQKFTKGGEQYVYRIYIQYNGGEWTDRKNWCYGELTIENTKTGQQYRYNGTMKQQDRLR